MEAVDPLREAYSCWIWLVLIEGEAVGIDDDEPGCLGPERDLQKGQYAQLEE